ncbi:MAG TPA: hypothetical protein VIU40_06950 [Geobacteraceae bacterium]
MMSRRQAPHPRAVFGIATLPEDAKTKLELIRLADKAMYAVKESTRDAIKACQHPAEQIFS